MNEVPKASGRPAIRRNSFVASSSAFANSFLNLLILALSARQGQTGEIAAYTVVTSALTLVAVAVAGGTPLLYVSGNDEEREAVRAQFVFFVLPILLLGTVVVSALYVGRGYVWSALLATGLVVAGNSVSHLHFAELTRQMRFTAMALVICGSKAVALVLVVAGFRMTLALLAAVAIQVAAGEASLRKISWLRREHLKRLSPRLGLSGFRLNRQLFAYSASEVYVIRGTSLGLSLVVSPRTMGYFGTAIAAYQGFTAVLSAGLHVPMALRARLRHGIGRPDATSQDAEVLAFLAAVGASVMVLFLAPWITTEVLRVPVADFAAWIRILAVSMPFVVINRAVALNAVGSGEYGRATKVMLFTAAVLTLVGAWAIPVFGPLGAAWATLVAETGTALVLVYYLVRRRLNRPGTRHLDRQAGAGAVTHRADPAQGAANDEL